MVQFFNVKPGETCSNHSAPEN